MSCFPDLRDFLKILENRRPLWPHIARVAKNARPPRRVWCPNFGPIDGAPRVADRVGARDFVLFTHARLPLSSELRHPSSDFEAAWISSMANGADGSGAVRVLRGWSELARQGDVASQGCFCVGLACPDMRFHSGES